MTARMCRNLITALVVAVLLVLILVVTSGCNATFVTITRPDGTEIKGKRISPAYKAEGVMITLKRDKDGIIGFEFSATKIGQAGPEQYAEGVAVGIRAATRAQQSQVIVVPLQSTNGDN